jgi:hypothetical protein
MDNLAKVVLLRAPIPPPHVSQALGRREIRSRCSILSFVLSAVALVGCGSGMDIAVKAGRTDCGLDCEVYGECSVASNGRCVADDTSCKKAQVCAQSGRCKEVDRVCVAGADDDCKKSRDCTERGMCRVKAGRCDAQGDAVAGAGAAQ